MKHTNAHIVKPLLLSVFAIQNPSNNIACNNAAMNTIASLAPKGCEIVRNKGNMLIRKGDRNKIQPFFLSHMDQVHDYIPYMQLSIRNGVLSAADGNGKQCGVGGDDKCGIYLALRMLHLLPNCTAVFVRDEEVGCQGSTIVPLPWFDNAAFVIQADRNNMSFDIIDDTNGMLCASAEFMTTILGLPAAKRHKREVGSITDIGELASRGLEVSMVNISSGYHNPHSRAETVRLHELDIACQLAYQMATGYGDIRWHNEPESSWQSWAGGGKYGGGYEGGYDSHFKASSNPKTIVHPVTKDMNAHQISEWLWNTAYMMDMDEYAEVLVKELVSLGFDRDLDALEHQDIDTLEGLIQDGAVPSAHDADEDFPRDHDNDLDDEDIPFLRD